MTQVKITDIDTDGGTEGQVPKIISGVLVYSDDTGGDEALIPVVTGSIPPELVYTPDGNLVFLKVPIP